MGYLAQKKKNIREEIIFKTLVVILSIITLIPLFFGSFLSIENILFHVYFIILIALFFSIVRQKFLYLFIFSIILLINYFYISSSSILFFAPQKQADTMTLVRYENNNIIIENTEVLQKGFLKLDTIYAPFSKIKGAKYEQLFIGIDFSNLKNINRALQQLRNFIISQDSPVIVVGDFSLPAWSSVIKKFLDDTNLEVKNKLMFVSSYNKNAFFSVPSYNILAFHNTVISDINITDSKEKTPVIEFKFGFALN